MSAEPDAAQTAGVAALIAFESEMRDGFAAKVPGTSALLWPLARSAVATAIAATDMGTGVASYATPSARQRAVTAARRLLPNPHSSDRAPRADHLFVVGGWTRTPTPEGYENWLVDDFAAALGDQAIVVQDAFRDVLSRDGQRPLLGRQTYSYARASERVGRAAARHPLSETDAASVRRTVRDYFRELPLEVPEPARARAEEDVVGRATRARAGIDEFSRLLDRVQPRRIYMQTAAYGVKSPQIREAHARGIPVSELQHGWVGRSHLAYNFGPVMAQAPLRDHLPDKLLTFGSFWGEHLRFPGELVDIGKPSLDRLQHEAPAFERRAPRLLFISTRYAHSVLEDVVLALRDALPAEWTFAVRPHPSERAGFEAKVPRLVGESRIAVDDIADADASLMASRAVVGFSSTMLYEALAYRCHVAVVESDAATHYTDDAVFPLRIANGSDLGAVAAVLTAPPAATERALADRVWRPDAVEHFLAEARR